MKSVKRFYGRKQSIPNKCLNNIPFYKPNYNINLHKLIEKQNKSSFKLKSYNTNTYTDKHNTFILPNLNVFDKYHKRFFSTILTKKYGWVKDKNNRKYNTYKLNEKCKYIAKINNFSLDMLFKLPFVYDQKNLGSCTSNAILFAYKISSIKSNVNVLFEPSRLFLYYCSRDIEGTTNEDSGCQIQDGVLSLNKTGVCSEKLHPYIVNNFTKRPSKKCYDEAKLYNGIPHYRVEHSIEHLKNALLNGFSVIFGFNVYESFESEEVEKTGIMPIPKDNENIVGGHAVSIIGFDDYKQVFIVRNSWGDKWGDKGNFYMPYSFIKTNECSDFWIIGK